MGANEKACDPLTLIAIGAFDLGVVAWLRAVTAEVAHLLAVAAGDTIGVAWLLALLGNMAFFAAITTCTRSPCRAVLGEMTHWAVRIMFEG